MMGLRNIFSAMLLSAMFAGCMPGDEAGAADLPPIAPRATTPTPEPPPCATVLEQITNGNLRDRWCRSTRPTYEARRDIWRSTNGTTFTYFKTSHYDCHNAADFSVIPPVTKATVC